MRHGPGILRRALGWASFLLALFAVGCREPLRLPDRTSPRCVVFEFGPEVQDPAGLRADLTEAFKAQWHVVPEGAEAPANQCVLRVRVTRQVLQSKTSGGNGLLITGSLILGFGGLVMQGASGWDTLLWIPIAGASVPLIATGLVQKVKSHHLDRRRGYAMPVFKATLRLDDRGALERGWDRVSQQDLRELAPPLDAERARDPLQVRKACARALARYVQEESGLGAP